MTIAAALWLAAAAADPLATLQATETRVATIAWRLQRGGWTAGLCPDAMPMTGLVLHDRAQYPAEQRGAVAARFGLGARPGVLALVPDGPAANAGVRIGDAIATVGGVAVAETPAAASGYAPLAAVEALLDAAPRSERSGGSASLGIERGGARLTVALAPESGCKSRVQLVPGRKRNASADGFYVQLTNAMIAEAASDDELAFVIAHEMAHNILAHPPAKGRKAASIRATESAADSFAIRLMRAARFDPDAAATFWARFGAKTGYGILSDGTHLRTKARVRLLRAAAAAVRGSETPAQ